MSTQSTDPSQSKDFLLTEHKYFAESFWRNEETGERRVNFFISLVTAVIGALVAFATTQEGALDPGAIQAIVIYGLLALLLVGLLTLLRLIKRNEISDRYKDALDTIREQFQNPSLRLADYDPFKRRAARQNPRTLWQGALTEIVALINSLIVAALAAIVIFPAPLINLGLSALAGLAVSAAAQGFYIQRRYNAARKK